MNLADKLEKEWYSYWSCISHKNPEIPPGDMSNAVGLLSGSKVIFSKSNSPSKVMFSWGNMSFARQPGAVGVT